MTPTDAIALANELGQRYASEREAILRDSRDGLEYQGVSALSDATDRFVRAVFDAVSEETPDASRGLAIAAVGGFGRREMFPSSDVDLTFIGTEIHPQVESAHRQAFRLLSDALASVGVEFGYSYTQPDDLEGLPIENLSALYDARFIAGSKTLFAQFQTALPAAIGQAAFVLQHMRFRQELDIFLETPFQTEPELKNGAGGLRDIHAALWISRASFGFPASSVWEGLRSRGIVNDSELTALDQAVKFISSARWILHAEGGKDVLTREKQAICATRLGFPGPLEFIAEYYRHSANVRGIYNRAAFACEAAELEFEPGVRVSSGVIRVLDKDLFAREGAAMLRVFGYAQQYGLRLDPDAGRLVAQNAPGLKLNTEISRAFMDILSQPSASHILRSMADHGLLQHIVPRFDEMMRLSPADRVHRFTVGEHTLRAVEELELVLTTDKEVNDVSARLKSTEALFIATLTHDIGKIEGDGHHSEKGALPAREFAEALGMSENQCNAVESLVRWHTFMSETARLRDVSRGRTAREFAEIVKDRELLDMLLLLTIADYNAVGSATWSELHRSFLLELHARTYEVLSSTRTTAPDIERHRTRIKRELSPENLSHEEVDAHCSSLPDRYLLNTPPKEMALHIRLVRHAAKGKAAIDFKDDRKSEYTRLTAVAVDRPGLLSDIAGTLYALDVNVHSAQVYTRADGICIDILYVDFDGHALPDIKKDEVEGELISILEQKTTCSELFARCRKPAVSLPDGVTAVQLPSSSDTEVVMEIRAPDVPGMLYTLTRRLFELGLSIHNAKVATWGHKIRDVFYLTDSQGNKPSEEILERLQTGE